MISSVQSNEGLSRRENAYLAFFPDPSVFFMSLSCFALAQ
jgi:hypothetical protein